ncbi:glycosyltransferase family 1 protein [Helcobacillus sp. ACRRO]|uniref:glycosyltransferase family 4 protein n=1 Tax=Helcobacillus sp. ACRRO TaxID=2918202 RepID=UPI001EF3DEF9|nr:glycosyltransferase family 1 protein [Helcobacillus sp. ACRRO]MCG7427013.1 glycosyltransferase family 1 protein [Helcobacillus sp. ACRRO]
MKVLIVTETFIPSIDGVVTRLKRLIDHLISEGHEVQVIAPDLGARVYETGGRRVLIHGVRAVKTPFYSHRPWSLPLVQARIVADQVVQDFRPDVIHAVQPILLAQVGVWAAKKYGIPLAASYHTNLPAYLERYPAWSWGAPLVGWATEKMHRDAEVNIATSATARSELMAQGVRRVDVVPSGVDTELYRPSRADDEMRERLGGVQGRRLLLFVGRLAAEKDLHLLEPMMRRRDDIALAVVGDGPVRGELEQLFAGTNTTFAGFMRGEELARAFASADAFVFPSVTETLGLVILEAKASGLPVIAARSGPTMEQITSGENGILFDVSDSAVPGGSLERAVELLDDPRLVDRVRAAGRADAEEHSWPRASAVFVALYEKAIRRHREAQAFSTAFAVVEQDLADLMDRAEAERAAEQGAGDGQQVADAGQGAGAADAADAAAGQAVTSASGTGARSSRGWTVVPETVMWGGTVTIRHHDKAGRLEPKKPARLWMGSGASARSPFFAPSKRTSGSSIRTR